MTRFPNTIWCNFTTFKISIKPHLRPVIQSSLSFWSFFLVCHVVPDLLTNNRETFLPDFSSNFLKCDIFFTWYCCIVMSNTNIQPLNVVSPVSGGFIFDGLLHSVYSNIWCCECSYVASERYFFNPLKTSDCCDDVTTLVCTLLVPRKHVFRILKHARFFVILYIMISATYSYDELHNSVLPVSKGLNISLLKIFWKFAPEFWYYMDGDVFTWFKSPTTEWCLINMVKVYTDSCQWVVSTEEINASLTLLLRATHMCVVKDLKPPLKTLLCMWYRGIIPSKLFWEILNHRPQNPFYLLSVFSFHEKTLIK